MSKLPELLRNLNVIVTKPSDGSDPFPFAPTTAKERRLGRTRSTIGQTLPNGAEHRVSSHEPLLADPDLPISREVYVPVRQAFLDNFGFGDVSERQIVDDERTQYELQQSRLSAIRRLKRERQSALDTENAKLARTRDQYMRISAMSAQLQATQLANQAEKDRIVAESIDARLAAELAEKKAKDDARLAEENALREAAEALAAGLLAEKARQREREAEEARKRAEAEALRIAEEEAERQEKEQRDREDEEERQRLKAERLAREAAEERQRPEAEQLELFAAARARIETDKVSISQTSQLLTTTLGQMEQNQAIFSDGSNDTAVILQAVSKTDSLYDTARSLAGQLGAASQRIAEDSLIINADNGDYITSVKTVEGKKISRMDKIYQESFQIGESLKAQRLLRQKQNVEAITQRLGFIQTNITNAKAAQTVYNNLQEKTDLDLRKYRSTVLDQYRVALGHQTQVDVTLGNMKGDYEPAQFDAESVTVRKQVQELVDVIKSIVDEITAQTLSEDNDGELDGGADDDDDVPVESKYNFRARHK